MSVLNKYRYGYCSNIFFNKIDLLNRYITGIMTISRKTFIVVNYIIMLFQYFNLEFNEKISVHMEQILIKHHKITDKIDNLILYKLINVFNVITNINDNDIYDEYERSMSIIDNTLKHTIILIENNYTRKRQNKYIKKMYLDFMS